MLSDKEIVTIDKIINNEEVSEKEREKIQTKTKLFIKMIELNEELGKIKEELNSLNEE